MQLEHLKKTLKTCIEKNEAWNRTTRTAQLKEQLETANSKSLENEIKTNGLYLGQSK